MDGDSLIDVFTEVATAIGSALESLDDWGSADGHPGQYRHDVVADEIAVPMLLDAGLGVISEESGPHLTERLIVAVIDPVDGSTNAAIGLPWYATSICAVDAEGPLAALVVNQALDVAYTAIRGEGAARNGSAISPSATTAVADSVLVFNDLPHRHLGWRQFRVYGAAALDLCAVADGTFDGFIDFSSGLSPWDHAGAVLICREAGATVSAVAGSNEHDTTQTARTRIVAGATAALCSTLVGLAT